MNLNAHFGSDDQVVFRDDYCEILNLTALACICQRYFKTQVDVDGACLKNSLQMILELAKTELSKGRHMHYLIEVNEGRLLPSDDVTWIRKDFIPQLHASGICYVAYVSKNNVFSQFVLETLLEGKSPDKVTIRVFQDMDMAFEWLRHVP